jgi:hypothetical protein
VAVESAGAFHVVRSWTGLGKVARGRLELPPHNTLTSRLGSGPLHSVIGQGTNHLAAAHTSDPPLRSAEASSDQDSGRPGPDQWQCRSWSVECLFTFTARYRVTRPALCVVQPRTSAAISDSHDPTSWR